MVMIKFIFFFRKALVNWFLIPILKLWYLNKYRLLSTCLNVKGYPKLNQPILTNGIGQIIFGQNVNIGISNSPYFFNSYAYLEVRNINSKIIISDNVWINNNACFISEGEGISIGRNTLIGMNFSVYDSDFHELSVNNRIGGQPKTGAVKIGENVFIGSNVTILKNVIIGDNSVVGSGSVVTKSIPNNVIATGNPCKIIKDL